MDPGAGQGKTCLQIILESARQAAPIYYGSKVLHLWSQPSRESARALAQAIQEVTTLAVERIDVEFDVRRPEVAFTALDIGRWTAASEENRQGRREAWDLLLKHSRDLLVLWGLSRSQGVPELEACAWALVGAERERLAASPGSTDLLDNRILWSRVFDPDFVKRVRANGELHVVPVLIRIYVSADDGTGQVERNLGKLKTVLEAHSGSTDEDGHTIAWLTDILLDGPEDETGLAVRASAQELSGGQVVPADITVDVDSTLQPTEFTRSCCELWITLHGRRFRVYAPRPTGDAQAKAKAKAGSMKSVAQACRKARDALVDRRAPADADVTLVGLQRDELARHSPHIRASEKKIKNFIGTTAKKRLAMQQMEHLRRRGRARGVNPYSLGDLNPTKKLRRGPTLSGCQGVPGDPAVHPARLRAGGAVRVLNCTATPLQDVPGNYTISRLRSASVWDDWRKADLVVWESPWQLDQQSAATSDFLKIAFLATSRGAVVLPKSAWRPGLRAPHRAPELVRFTRASTLDKATLVMGDGFRGMHPALASLIQKACCNSKWDVVKVLPPQPDAQPKAQAKAKGKAKGKAKAKPKPQLVVQFSSLQDVRCFLQRVRRVSRSEDAGLAGSYFLNPA